MKIFLGMLFEIAVYTAIGVLLFLIAGVVGTFVTWHNMFTDDDTMLGLRLFTGAGFAVGVVRACVIQYFWGFK